MKPLLKSVPLTDEDLHIRLLVGGGWGGQEVNITYKLIDLGDIQDRRDAALLLGLRQLDCDTWQVRPRHITWAFYTVRLRWDASLNRVVVVE